MGDKEKSKFLNMTLAQGRFVVMKKIGAGSFGDIYQGLDKWRNRDVAIKLELTKARHPQLLFESKVYKLLHHNNLNVVGIPELHWYGQEEDVNMMVLDLCGPSLEELFSYCNRKFTIKTICMLADQILHRLEYIHHQHLLHRDLKPENFVMGVADKGHHVYLIDYGLSKKYWDSKVNQHIPYKEGKPLTGTARYCSINTHLGIEQSRRDDLESAGYIFLYFSQGELPWQGIRVPDPTKKTERIGEKKISCGLDYLCRHDHPAFLKYMKYCRTLKFEDVPDYEWCRSLFREMADKGGVKRDWIFDWVDVRQREIADCGAKNYDGSESSKRRSTQTISRPE